MTLAGRQILFRRANLGQVIMLQRIYVRASKQADKEPTEDVRVDMMGSAMVKVLDFIDSLMVNEDDRIFVEEQMLAGQIGINDLMSALGGGPKPEAPADDEAPKPRAVKKSPKAAPAAKTVATRGRAKR